MINTLIKFKRTPYVLFILCFWGCSISLDINAKDIEFSGFASIRVGALTDNIDRAPYLSSTYQDTDISFKEKSLFALQSSVDLDDGLSATLQLMANGADDFELEAQWAYLRYQVNEKISVLAGRFALPMFRRSDLYDIGYAHEYERLPAFVYHDYDFRTIEGARLMFDDSVDEFEYNLTTSFGSWNGDIYSSLIERNIKSRINNLWQFSGDLHWRWLNVYAGGFIGEWQSEEYDQYVINDILLAPVSALIESTQFDKERVFYSGDDVVYYSYGMNIDYYGWLLHSEFSLAEIQNSLDESNDAWFLSVGRRFDVLTVLVGVEEIKQTVINQDKFSNSSSSELNRYLTDINALNSVNLPADSIYISLRYDFHSNAAFKASYTHFEYKYAGCNNNTAVNGLYICDSNSGLNNEGQDSGIISAGIDVVF